MQYYIVSLIFLFSFSVFSQDRPEPAPLTVLNPAPAIDKPDLGGLVQLPAAVEQSISAVKDIATNASDIKASATSITADSEKVSNQALADIQKNISQALPLLIPYPGSQAALEAINGKMTSYFQGKKKTCTTTAEVADFTCPEGNSPGAKAAKLIMDAGAPVLAVIASAQKACSSSAKITAAASKALTIAKGVCLGAKTTCDFSCSGAITQLAEIQMDIENFSQIYMKEIGAGIKLCAAIATAETPQCLGVGPAKAVPPLVMGAAKYLAAEKVPATSGTTAFMAAKCTGYSKDVALFAVNIAQTMMANKGAADCADKLASSGTKGAISTIQYCETPANANTQFCLCKSNENQPGCAGYKTTLNEAPKLTDDQNGTDVKNSGKGNQFAGGFANKNSGGFNLGSGDMVNGDLVDSKSAKDKKAEEQKLAALTTTGGSGVDAMPTGSGAGAGLDGTVKATDAEKKKWSFGAFSGGFGGGGSGSSSGRAGQNKLGQKEMDAIKRQMASEQLRAEVSESSGKSNWEKVRAQYTSKTSTFLLGK